MKFSSLVRVAVALFVLLGTYAFAGPPGTGYHQLKRLSLANPGQKEYFDYVVVDNDARRVYLTHGFEVKVLDADSLAVIATIGGLVRCHGVAIVKDLNKGFITDGEAAKIVVFDLKSLKVTGSIHSSDDTDSIVYDPVSKYVVSFNGDSKNATVVDPKKETVVKVIDLGGGPEGPVVDGKGMIYDNNADLNAILAIDTKSLTIKDKWPTAPAGEPTALAMDRQHRRLFCAGRSGFLANARSRAGKFQCYSSPSRRYCEPHLHVGIDRPAKGRRHRGQFPRRGLALHHLWPRSAGS